MPNVAELLASDVAEKGGQAVIVVLGPDVEWVIVTARALEANSEEDLSHGLSGRHRVAVGAMKTRRRVLPVRAQAGDDLPRQVVERDIAGQLVAQPALKDPGPLLTHRLLFVAQQIGPLERPEIGEFGTVDELVDRAFRAYQDRSSRENARAIAGSGRRPIASRNARRRKMESSQTEDGLTLQGPQLGEDERIDGPLDNRRTPDEPRAVGQKGKPARPPAVHEPDGDRRFARSAGREPGHRPRHRHGWDR